MAVLLNILSFSGGGKNVCIRYILDSYPFVHTLPSYVTRPAREDDDPDQCKFVTKEFFREHEGDFLEFFTYPPHSDPKDEHVHYYGKLKSQFDGRDAIQTLEEVGLQTYKRLEEEGKLPGYKVIAVFIHADPEIRRARVNDDKRFNRSLKRIALPDDFYDYHLYNNGTLEEFYAQIDEMMKELFAEEVQLLHQEV